MSSSTEFELAFDRARKLHVEGRLAEAEQAYGELATEGNQPAVVLDSLAELYLQTQRPTEAVESLAALTREDPDSLYYTARLADALDGLGHTESAINQFMRLLRRQPELAAAHFNVALLYKKQQLYSKAMAAYESAVRLGIDHVEEVYSNMGVLYSEMRDAENSRAMYERALEHDPEYIPALFNLAGLIEETGDLQRSTELYQQILSIDPRHWESLARLAYGKRVTDADNPIVDALSNAIGEAQDEQMAQEGLYFAQGKALDDLGRYDEAFGSYNSANELGKRRNRPYDRLETEQGFEQLISLFNADWMQNAATGSTATPVFVCGMFRSGSTLTEQILAAHPSVTAGGELDFLPWLLTRRLGPYPQRIGSTSREDLERLGNEYLTKVQDIFPNNENVIDKRPDNFLHLGLIKAMFPSARIVYTKRKPLDNCLSVYFQQFGGHLSYATDLEDTAHYFGQHERLMAYWQTNFGENIFTLDYDELVNSPEPVLRALLDFLGLDWDDRCLSFQETEALVKTASVWQVREELHAASSGRWHNYESFVGNIKPLLKSD